MADFPRRKTQSEKAPSKQIYELFDGEASLSDDCS